MSARTSRRPGPGLPFRDGRQRPVAPGSEVRMNRIARLTVASAAIAALGIASCPPPWAQEAATPGSTCLRIVGAGRTARAYTLADLQREPVTTEAVYFGTGKGPVRATFTGAL